MTVQRWEQPTLPGPGGRDTVDGWVTQVTAVVHLADIIAETDFVPGAYRNQPAAVAAAILAGREMGIGPMTALQHLYIIDGRPAMSSQLMRALVLAHGHTLRIDESTGTRCTITGRRANGPELTVVWDIGMANAAGLTQRRGQAWRQYPRAMLLARATGELCRAMFADVLGGMAYTLEEAQDIPDGEPPSPRRGSRTVARARTVVDAPPLPIGDPVARPDEVGPPVAQSPPAAGPPAPPLPDDASPEPAPKSAIQPPRAPDSPEPRLEPDEPAAAQDEPPQPDDGHRPATGAQRANIHAQLGALGLNEPRAKRHHTISGLIHRRISTQTQVTRNEATALIDTLARAVEEQITPADLDALVLDGWAHILEAEHDG